MPEIAKRKYNGELIRFSKSMKQPLNRIVETLAPGYSGKDLLDAFTKYYPFEWRIICERQNTYAEKDAFLKKQHKKTRYKPLNPTKYFFSLQKVKNILSEGFRKKHTQNYNEEVRLQKEIELKRERVTKIEKRQSKIDQNSKLQQQIDPGFLDALIYAYHSRNNTINDKIEIFKEIQKYDCDKSVTFFRKLNDSERNDEIRNLAFQHLQKTGHYVKLRKKFKGKKKQYYTEKNTFFGTPELLLEKLQKASLTQRVKHFDLFISHSSKDIETVHKIVNLANDIGFNCYVDWLSDDNFLKRSMVSEYTREVLKFRLSQSKKLLYLSSSNSRESPWVIFELDYFLNTVKREMKMILLDGTDERALKYIDYSDLNKEELDRLLRV